MQHRIVTIRLTGNARFPEATIRRDNKPRKYVLNDIRMKWFEELLAKHLGPFYFDLYNSEIEVYFPKQN